MRAFPAAVVVLLPGMLLAGLYGWFRDGAVGPPPGEPPEDPGRIELVPAVSPASPAAPSARTRADRVAETLRAHPDAAVVTCRLDGALKFAVMPLHVHLDRPGEPPPFDYAVVEDTLVVAVPPGSGGINLGTGDGAGFGRFGWPDVAPGGVVDCGKFVWTQGRLTVPGRVRGAHEVDLQVRACGAGGGTFSVGRDGSFTLSIDRSAEFCPVRLESRGRTGPWKEIRADRLDGTVWLDVPDW